ncbi:MAG TPA: adenosylcobinamide-GDP ribazoletransferase [Prevotella sp.]|nr:adenosylcobinamide-GDP ribazoletransferase [Prevotella sp.]
MKLSINHNIKFYDRIFAALIFFTRLPFWRIHQPPKAAYETVVEHWPATGWLTGAIMGGTLFICSFIFPLNISILLAIVARIFITGALHEDGLTDFFDGFGGGRSKEQTLEIMKDSRIGTYGVVGLIFYELLLFFGLYEISSKMGTLYAALVIFAGDPYTKMIAAQIIEMMPYARTAETAKNGVVYRKFSIKAGMNLFFQGALPMCLYGWIYGFNHWEWFIFVPCIVMYFLYMLMNKKIEGYTGDCCGAVFLICELSFYLTVLACL